MSRPCFITRQQLCDLADQGLIREEIARHTGKTYRYICYATRRWKIPIQHGNRRSRTTVEYRALAERLGRAHQALETTRADLTAAIQRLSEMREAVEKAMTLIREDEKK